MFLIMKYENELQVCFTSTPKKAIWPHAFMLWRFSLAYTSHFPSGRAFIHLQTRNEGGAYKEKWSWRWQSETMQARESSDDFPKEKKKSEGVKVE